MNQAVSIASLLPDECHLCPRDCGARRARGETGVCGAADTLRLARASLHLWEEPLISGHAGSGTIFFSGCPLRCVYCQNASIALGETGKSVSFERLVEIMLELQSKHALNINCVTPTHYTPVIIAAVHAAREQGLQLPVVWNTSGYELGQTIAELKGTADVFLTDFKYGSPRLARSYSHAPDYPQRALAALEEMLACVGRPVLDEYEGQERMVKGVVVRHLLLPGHLEDSKQVVRMVYEHFGDDLILSLMNQYTPVLKPTSSVAQLYPSLLTRPSEDEYEALLDYADALGVEDYFWQEGETAQESFIPPFDYSGL